MKENIFYNETTVLFIYICYVLFKNVKVFMFIFLLLRQQNKTSNGNAFWKSAITGSKLQLNKIKSN